MNLHASPTFVLDRAGVETASDLGYRPLLWRVALVFAIAMTAAVTAVVTAPFSVAAEMDPDLARLLRAMVGIKAIIALAATGLLLWRFGHPTSRPVAIGYGVAICVSIAALAWLWGLASIPLGALLFYGGLAGLVLVGRFDAGLSAPSSLTPLNRRMRCAGQGRSELTSPPSVR